MLGSSVPIWGIQSYGVYAMNNEYININKAFSSSLVERVGASTTLNSFVSIKKIAEAKGLKSTRSLRMELNKPESKYISREVKVNDGNSSLFIATQDYHVDIVNMYLPGANVILLENLRLKTKSNKWIVNNHNCYMIFQQSTLIP